MNRICVVITARPSYSRVKTLLYALKERSDVELLIVLAASALLDRFGKVSDFVERDGFTVNARVTMVLEGDSPSNMAKTTGLGIIELTSVFNHLQPSLVLTIADRYETLSTAVAASYMGIPLVHIQGGEITGSIDEKVRHAITKLSDYHFPCTQKSADRLLAMGEAADRVFNFGCPSIDIARNLQLARKLSFNPYKEYMGVGPAFSLSDPYIVVMFHPVTEEYEHLEQYVNSLLSSVLHTGKNIIWFWPNVDAGSDKISRVLRNYRESSPEYPLHCFKNMSSTHFLELLAHSQLLIGNSSVAIRECSYLGVKAVNIGTRQSKRERASNVFDCDYSTQSINAAIQLALDSDAPRPSALYGNGNAGEKIATLLSGLNPSIKPPFIDP